VFFYAGTVCDSDADGAQRHRDADCHPDAHGDVHSVADSDADRGLRSPSGAARHH
jgi:hypothetical protein